MSDLILSVEKLNLVFRLNVHRSWTLRQGFARLLSDPFKALHPEYDRFHVLRDVKLDVRKGERVGIIGLNGAGKTTLCRCITGTFQPTSGRVNIAGPIRAIFNTQVGVQPELTGRENAEILAQFIFPEESDLHDLVEEALEFSELGRFADVPYKNYSNGMQARLCLSLISARPAHLLILDEVFDGADVFFREKIADRIMKTIKASGAVLFVSHSSDQIEKVCTRVIVLHHGVIVFDGPTREGLKFFETLGPTQKQVLRHELALPQHQQEVSP
jgi:ABC-type polysaccharide/polyol phosphate transport system ATPase subunit